MINRVLFVTRFLNGGGAERVISVLANSLVKQGCEVGIMSYILTDHDYEIANEVSVFSMGSEYSEGQGNSVSRTLYRRKKLAGVVKSYSPDLIIPFLEPIVQETYFTVGNMGIPIIATVRNLPQYSTRLKKLIYIYVLNHCTALFLQTEDQAKYFSDFLRSKSFVIPNPVDDSFLSTTAHDKLEALRGDCRVIINVGRLEPQKNQKLLIKAMIEIHKTYKEYRLHIYGEGNERTKLEELIQKNSADDYIFLMGRKQNILSELRNADMFVLSSDFEGMPNALLEAMAAGVPVISTDCPTGPRDLIGDDENGLLIPVNDIGRMIKGIEYYIENPDQAAVKSRRARRYIQNHYSADTIASTLLQQCNRFV